MLLKKKNKENILKIIYDKDRFKRTIEFLLGLFVLSLAYNIFILPNNIVYGVGGIGVILKKLFDFNPSITMLVGNILLLILSYFCLGSSKTTGTILGSILYPIFISITVPISNLINVGTNDILLLTIFGATLTGFGHGLIFKSGYTTGGTDILNQIVEKYFKVSLGTSMIFTDGIIIVGGVFVFGWSNVMYSLISLYIISIITDKVVLGISKNKAFYIITEFPNEVTEFILNNISHGVTVLNARGGYSNDKEKMLLCVVPTNMYFRLKEGINYIDKNAFFVVTDAYETSGGSINN